MLLSPFYWLTLCLTLCPTLINCPSHSFGTAAIATNMLKVFSM